MSTKIAILKIDKKGTVTTTVTEFTNDAEAKASIKVAGTYAFLEVHDIDPKKKEN